MAIREQFRSRYYLFRYNVIIRAILDNVTEIVFKNDNLGYTLDLVYRAPSERDQSVVIYVPEYQQDAAADR